MTQTQNNSQKVVFIGASKPVSEALSKLIKEMRSKREIPSTAEENVTARNNAVIKPEPRITPSVIDIAKGMLIVNPEKLEIPKVVIGTKIKVKNTTTLQYQTTSNVNNSFNGYGTTRRHIRV